MKKKIRTLLCLLLVFLFVGSGFSAWYFDDGTIPSSSVSGEVNITHLASAMNSRVVVKDGAADIYDTAVNSGTLAVPALNITLDQGGNLTDLNKTIYFGTDPSVTTKTLTYVLTIDAGLGLEATSEETTAAVDAVNAKTITPTFSVDLTSALGSYIEVVETPVLNMDSDDAATASTPRTITYSVTFGFKYKTGQKPLDVAAYNAMNTALASGQNVTVNCSFAES